MKLLVFAVLLASHLLLSQGCACLPTTLKKAFFNPANTRVVRATVIRVIEPCDPCTPADQLKKRRYLLKVVTVYKGCNVSRYIWVKSVLSSAACGIELQKGKDYLFPLSSATVPTLNLCQYIRLWNTQPRSDIDFLETREVCCNGRCTCVARPRVFCFVAPCLFSKPPCKEAVKCVDNYCGGCFAEWITQTGMPACEISIFSRQSSA